MSKPAEAATAVVMPSWTDPTSIAMYLTTLAAFVIGLVTLVHPGFNPPPTTVQAVIGGASLLIAGGVQVYNAARHTTATKAAITAGVPIAVLSGKGHVIVAPVTPPQGQTVASSTPAPLPVPGSIAAS